MNEPTPGESGKIPTEAWAELSPEQAMMAGLHFHKLGRLPEAEQAYRAVLATMPEHVDALHFLGLLLHQSGLQQEGLELVSKAVALRPDYADAHSNLGNLLRAQGRLEDAERAYRRALAVNPAHAQALNNLGVVLKDLGRFDQAVAAFKQAVVLDPARGDAHFNLANLLAAANRGEEAVAEYQVAIRLQPALLHAYEGLTRALRDLGRDRDADELARQLVQKAPGNPVAQHLSAAATGENVPAQAPDAYVRHLFDTFADTFDYVLGALDYQAPALVTAAVAREVPAARADLEVLDAGCGTGLCGPLLRPYARRLAGVDLSAGMLAKARRRGSYDELAQADLTQFMQQRASVYDIIASADTLVYFGRLNGVLAAAAAALRPGGLLIFTLEDAGGRAGEGGFRLQANGRYHHDETYARAVVADTGLSIRAIQNAVLRKEKDQPVPGLLIVARKNLRDAAA